MPVIWKIPEGTPAKTGALSDSAPGAAPTLLAQVILRPNRSLPRSGLAWLLLILWGLLLVPLFPLLGSVALWVMLPFLLGALAALWYFIERNYRDGEMYEELSLWPDRIRVEQHTPRKPVLSWEANPYWTSVNLRKEGGPVENYLTLKGAGREIELGVFLSPEERVELNTSLSTALARARTHAVD